MKYAMSVRGLPVQPICRSTVLPLTDEQKGQIEAILDNAQQIIENQGLL